MHRYQDRKQDGQMKKKTNAPAAGHVVSSLQHKKCHENNFTLQEVMNYDLHDITKCTEELHLETNTFVPKMFY